jgi:hypothetical protein
MAPVELIVKLAGEDANNGLVVSIITKNGILGFSNKLD